jgi:hypothetical protein
MSSELLTSTYEVSATVAPIRRLAGFQVPIQKRKPFFKIQRRVMSSNTSPRLDHREGHLGCSPTITVSRAAQPGHVRDRAYRPGGERIHHVDRGDVTMMPCAR